MTPTFPNEMTPLGPVNWIGFWTLYTKEVRRFLKVWLQTIAAPVISTLIFMAIFVLAIGKTRGDMAGVPFTDFLLPGLVMMTILQNGFANSSSSLVIAKMQGNIIDVLMPPLSSWELSLAFVGGGATRGLLVGGVVATVLLTVSPIEVQQPLVAMAFMLEAALMMSSIGVLTGIWAEKFDQTSVITNFIVTPLSFLSGTFYSIDHLPESVQWFAHINPFFYMIDGFRGAMIGVSWGHVGYYLLVLTAMNVVLLWCVQYLFRIGYKIKS
jgi:ABC-2 type transport system permease protein